MARSHAPLCAYGWRPSESESALVGRFGQRGQILAQLRCGRRRKRRNGLPIVSRKNVADKQKFVCPPQLLNPSRSPAESWSSGELLHTICRSAATARPTRGTRAQVIFRGCLHPTNKKTGGEHHRAVLPKMEFGRSAPRENGRRLFSTRQKASQKIPDEKQQIHLLTDLQIWLARSYRLVSQLGKPKQMFPRKPPIHRPAAANTRTDLGFLSSTIFCFVAGSIWHAQPRHENRLLLEYYQSCCKLQLDCCGTLWRQPIPTTGFSD